MGGRRLTPGAPCTTCGTPMRPAGTRVTDHPGTSEHRGKGICGVCSEHTRRDRASRALGPDFPGDDLPGLTSDDPQVRRDARMLRDYMKRRRQ